MKTHVFAFTLDVGYGIEEVWTFICRANTLKEAWIDLVKEEYFNDLKYSYKKCHEFLFESLSLITSIELNTGLVTKANSAYDDYYFDGIRDFKSLDMENN